MRDFAEAYRNWDRSDADEASIVVKLAEASSKLLDSSRIPELRAFIAAQEMLAGELAAEDRPMVEQLRVNAALRFARKLALLPPI